MIRKKSNTVKSPFIAMVLIVILSLLFTQGATSVSARDDLDQAVEAASFDIIAGLAKTAPTLDGVLSAGEWEDALSYNITKSSTASLDESEGAKNLPQLFSGVVTLYVMNDEDTLYLAIDNTIDTVFTANDQLGVYFDDNPLPSDGQWTNTSCGHPDGEGGFALLSTSAIWFNEMINSGGPVDCGYLPSPTGVTGWMGGSSGHVQTELAIDLTTSALRATPGDMVKMFMWAADGVSAVVEGEWPAGGDPDLPATFGAVTLATGYNLQVSKSGTGSGTVTSEPEGIDCGLDCSDDFLADSSVTLTANPDGGSFFTGWEGACTGTGTCTVTMTEAKAVTAKFELPFILLVSKSGTGSGTVSSTPAGISCGADCSEGFAPGTQVKLTAMASAGSAFTGWSGACGGVSTTCYVTMSKAKNVTATFTLNPPGQYYLSTVKVGSGSIVSTPAGITCPTDCGEFYTNGTSVKLVATASAGYVFTGWNGACGGTSSTCFVPMTKNKTVTATFLAVPAGTYYLGVKKAGSGFVESYNYPGISCGTDCYEFYSSTLPTSVRLKATPAAGYTVTWSGACGGTSLNCYVTMSTHKFVKATFSLIAQVEEVMRKVALNPLWRWLGN